MVTQWPQNNLGGWISLLCCNIWTIKLWNFEEKSPGVQHESCSWSRAGLSGWLPASKILFLLFPASGINAGNNKKLAWWWNTPASSCVLTADMQLLLQLWSPAVLLWFIHCFLSFFAVIVKNCCFWRNNTLSCHTIGSDLIIFLHFHKLTMVVPSWEISP